MSNILFYDDFKGDKDKSSVDFKIWNGVKSNQSDRLMLELAYQSLNPGKKFKSKFNHKDHFLNLLFELYVFKFLKDRGVNAKCLLHSNDQEDIVFEIQNKKVICECMCINAIETEDELVGKVDCQLNNLGLVESAEKFPPTDTDKMMLRVRDSIKKKKNQLLNRQVDGDISILIFCSVHSDLKSKNPSLKAEFSHAVLGRSGSYANTSWCDAQKDTKISGITDGIDFIFLCDYTPLNRKCPLEFDTIYPDKKFPLRPVRSEVSDIEKDIFDLFSK